MATSVRLAKEKTSGRQQWHQGFATVRVGGTDVVPFVQHRTVQRVAAAAEVATGRTMLVLPWGDWWAYFPAPDLSPR